MLFRWIVGCGVNGIAFLEALRPKRDLPIGESAIARAAIRSGERCPAATRSQVFGMTVLACDPYLDEAQVTSRGARRVSLNELVAIAGMTDEALREMAASAARQWIALFSGKAPPHLVNPEVWPNFCERFEAEFSFRPAALPEDGAG